VDIGHRMGLRWRRLSRGVSSVRQSHVSLSYFSSHNIGLRLVFRVKLISGSLSHENTGNQLGHLAPILTFISLAVTAVLQIVCLNRALEIYDSTLVVPVFYGVYTATG
jgi:Magnesium transporter NIPA